MGHHDRRKPHFDWPALLMALTGAFIASGLIVILGFVTWALVFKQIPDANANAFTLLIGILSSNVGLIVGFFFGASYANSRKDNVIDTMAKTASSIASSAPSPPAPPGQVDLNVGDTVKVTAKDEPTP
jgi:hypothetical protein